MSVGCRASAGSSGAGCEGSRASFGPVVAPGSAESEAIPAKDADAPPPSAPGRGADWSARPQLPQKRSSGAIGEPQS